MSHLRAPAARADRREGGRHGRPVARTTPSLPEAPIRPQLMRLAVLPPVAVALGAASAVLFTVRTARLPLSPTLLAVLAGAVSVTVAAVAIAAVAARRATRSVQERVEALRRGATRREAELRALVDTLRRGEEPPRRKTRGTPPADADEFELLAADLARAHDGALACVVQAAQLSSRTGSEQKLEVFVNLARRLQSLVHREIAILDDLENELEDPELLKGLFQVDHLATRIRRHAENLAVLGGAVSRRQWSNPVPVTEVLRSAIAEVEQYSRVKLVPPVDGTLRGHAVADVIHLLAELVENATLFSAPQTQVLLRAGLVTSGLAIEVEDRGLGMPVEEQTRMNALLTDPDQVQVASLLADGRIGLFVVSQLARRHRITVRLQTNIYGGVQAVLVVPEALLGTPPPTMDQTGTGTGALPVAHHAGYGTAGALTGPYGGAGYPAGTYDTGGVPVAYGTVSPPADGVFAAQGTGSGPHPGAEPLPVRGAHDEWPGERSAMVPAPGTPGTPDAPSTPGIPSAERSFLEEHATTPLTPRSGAVPGTTGRPRLPRRHAQHHLAPQLRERPAGRAEPGTDEGHDPGLMAAYQRGVSLAEARYGPDPDPVPPNLPPDPSPGLPPNLPPDLPAPRPALLPSRTAAHHTHHPTHHHTVRHDGSAPAG
ncbi:ATP-binding protein [Streptomyces sp. NPDC093252]|uniref:sensor histidine kinase n=1 Tax=Streptomyces sp. NPDC093252 TaxID=3154980 RepID=UPI00342C470F